MLVARGLYRRWLTKYFSTITLAGLAPDDEPILLRRVYVPLILGPTKVSEYVPEEIIHREGQPLTRWLTSQALDLPGRENVLLISGEAGSGKTTLVSAIVDSLAGEVGDELNQQLEGWVPFPIKLREAPLDRIRTLGDLVDWWLEQARQEVPELEPDSLRSFLDMGLGIILLDGLDEVGTLGQRTRVMSWLAEHPWVRGHGFLIPASPVIVTGRPSGFEGLKPEYIPPSRALFVAPFSHTQIRSYLTRWFELRPLRSEQRQNTVENLVGRLTSSEQSGRLLPLARRPAYLASLAFIHGTRGELPYTRAALYEQLVEAYIEMLDRQRGVLDRAEKAGELPIWDRQEKIEVLSAVAFQAHVGATAKERESKENPEEDRRLLWSREELEGAVRIAVEDGAERFRTIQPEQVPQLTGYFVARTGLLVETREGQYQFGHLSFQEYLTALFVLNRATAGSDKAGELKRILFPRLGDPGWLEVGVLVLAIDANRSGGKGHKPVLAQINLNNPNQLAFLTQLLSGEEIRFTAEERRLWILIWLAFWAIRRDNADLNSALRFPMNSGPLEEAWRIVCVVLGDGGSAMAALAGLIERTLAAVDLSASSARRSLDALVDTSSNVATDSDMIAPRRAWSCFPNNDDPHITTARLLVIPLLTGFLPKDSEALLDVLPAKVDLFLRPEPSQILPTWIQYSLESWSFGRIVLLQSLAEHTPLLWWLQSEFFAFRMASSEPEAASSPINIWRSDLRKRIVRVEQLWWTCQLILGSDSKTTWYLDRAQERELIRDQVRNRELARDRELIRDLVLARELARDREPNRDRDLDLIRDLSRVRELTRDLEFDLARTFDKSLVQDSGRSRFVARSRNRTLDLSRTLEPFVYTLERRNKHHETPHFRTQSFDLLRAAVQGTALSWHLDMPRARRFEFSSFLEVFRKPERVVAPLQGTHFSEQALQEWAEVFSSPFSPIPLLEDLLSREWEELPTDPKGIAQLFEKALLDLEKSL